MGNKCSKNKWTKQWVTRLAVSKCPAPACSPRMEKGFPMAPWLGPGVETQSPLHGLMAPPLPPGGTKDGTEDMFFPFCAFHFLCSEHSSISSPKPWRLALSLRIQSHPRPGFPAAGRGCSGFPDGSAGRESACHVETWVWSLGLGRSPWGGNGYPLQYSGQKNFMDCMVHGVTKSQTRLSDLHFTFTWSHRVVLREGTCFLNHGPLCWCEQPVTPGRVSLCWLSREHREDGFGHRVGSTWLVAQRGLEGPPGPSRPTAPEHPQRFPLWFQNSKGKMTLLWVVGLSSWIAITESRKSQRGEWPEEEFFFQVQEHRAGLWISETLICF